jgi:hypothetical protein
VMWAETRRSPRPRIEASLCQAAFGGRVEAAP